MLSEKLLGGTVVKELSNIPCILENSLWNTCHAVNLTFSVRVTSSFLSTGEYFVCHTILSPHSTILTVSSVLHSTTDTASSVPYPAIPTVSLISHSDTSSAISTISHAKSVLPVTCDAIISSVSRLSIPIISDSVSPPTITLKNSLTKPTAQPVASTAITTVTSVPQKDISTVKSLTQSVITAQFLILLLHQCHHQWFILPSLRRHQYQIAVVQ